MKPLAWSDAMQPIDTDSRERTDDRADASAFPAAAEAATATAEPARMEAVAETPFALTSPT